MAAVPVLCLLGPTASGKSALALDLAERLGCDLVSVDSAQVYRGLDIGSAKPDAATRARVPHWLLDLREPDQPYSAADFVVDARAAIEAIHGQGRRALLVGGTFLYFAAFERGLSRLPATDPALRLELEARVESEGLARLHADLAALDPPTAAQLHVNDRQRILRALEVCVQSGQPMSALKAGQRDGYPGPLYKLALIPSDRRWLHGRIEQRLQRMIGEGFEAEVAALCAAGHERHLPALKAVGYRQYAAAVAASEPRAATVQKVLEATRQYAKRQLTWLRREPALRVIDPCLSIDVKVLAGEIEAWWQASAR